MKEKSGEKSGFEKSERNKQLETKADELTNRQYGLEQERDKTGKRAITILHNSESGEYYGIKTSGYEAIDRLNKRPLLWERGADAAPEDVATPTITTIEPQQGDEDTSRAKGQSNGSSGSKDSTLGGDVQEKSGEKSGFVTSASKRPHVRWNRRARHSQRKAHRQRGRRSRGSALKKSHPMVADAFVRYNNARGKPIRTAKEFQEKFFAVCKEKGYLPRFYRFINKNKNGDYVYTPGYHKLLLDFKLFDKNGKILPQKEIRPQFDNEFNKKILDKYVEDTKAEMPIDWIYGKVKERLEKEG